MEGRLRTAIRLGKDKIVSIGQRIIYGSGSVYGFGYAQVSPSSPRASPLFYCEIRRIYYNHV